MFSKTAYREKLVLSGQWEGKLVRKMGGGRRLEDSCRGKANYETSFGGLGLGSENISKKGFQEELRLDGKRGLGFGPRLAAGTMRILRKNAKPKK